ncbi:hypothetical protein PoB_000902700 [Plakobranchus ocellatus]|uniref:Uncharacterized protein n=1 Tax=Plakobranchus ocellatus TaxID=259542 RepID=A0AAV3YJZ0_9GAST|nr:hypothetical protein PoB_000902700 [Plakobranchus ocellatus]
MTRKKMKRRRRWKKRRRSERGRSRRRKKRKRGAGWRGERGRGGQSTQQTQFTHNDVISGFQALRQARMPMAGLEPATEGSLHISQGTILVSVYKQERHQCPPANRILRVQTCIGDAINRPAADDRISNLDKKQRSISCVVFVLGSQRTNCRHQIAWTVHHSPVQSSCWVCLVIDLRELTKSPLMLRPTKQEH